MGSFYQRGGSKTEYDRFENKGEEEEEGERKERKRGRGRRRRLSDFKRIKMNGSPILGASF